MNSYNLFEITHSLLRQFGPENWTLYRGKHLLSFVDNHDVTRVASILQNRRHLPLIYALLFGMPGIPCIYYGSEWGAEGNKQQGDDALRPSFDAPEWNTLTDTIAAMAKAHRESRALCYGDFRQLVLTNRQCIWERCADGERVLIAVNIDDQPYTAHFDAKCGRRGRPHHRTSRMISAAAASCPLLGVLLEVRVLIFPENTRIPRCSRRIGVFFLAQKGRLAPPLYCSNIKLLEDNLAAETGGAW